MEVRLGEQSAVVTGAFFQVGAVRGHRVHYRRLGELVAEKTHGYDKTPALRGRFCGIFTPIRMQGREAGHT